MVEITWSAAKQHPLSVNGSTACQNPGQRLSRDLCGFEAGSSAIDASQRLTLPTSVFPIFLSYNGLVPECPRISTVWYSSRKRINTSVACRSCFSVSFLCFAILFFSAFRCARCFGALVCLIFSR
jgi:hypothetical protein